MVINNALSIALTRIAGLTILSTAAFASAPAVAPAAAATVEGPSGFYATGRLGRGSNNWNQILDADVPSMKHKGFAGGVNVGYAFNQFLAIEAGYTYLPKTTWDVYLIESLGEFASGCGLSNLAWKI